MQTVHITDKQRIRYESQTAQPSNIYYNKSLSCFWKTSIYRRITADFFHQTFALIETRKKRDIVYGEYLPSTEMITKREVLEFCEEFDERENNRNNPHRSTLSRQKFWSSIFHNASRKPGSSQKYLAVKISTKLFFSNSVHCFTRAILSLWFAFSAHSIGRWVDGDVSNSAYILNRC